MLLSNDVTMLAGKSCFPRRFHPFANPFEQTLLKNAKGLLPFSGLNRSQ
jgi:hypothetical protein